MNVFDAYSPFIREFIYSRGWDHLNEIQVAAADFHLVAVVDFLVDFLAVAVVLLVDVS